MLAVDSAGNATPVPLPGVLRPGQVKIDSGGNMYVLDYRSGGEPYEVFKRTPDGTVTPYASIPSILPGPTYTSLNSMAVAGDGTVFIGIVYSDMGGGSHGEILELHEGQPATTLWSSAGVLRANEIATGVITVGPGGDLYVTTGSITAGGRILRVTRAGAMTIFFDTHFGPEGSAGSMRFSSDGDLFFLGPAVGSCSMVGNPRSIWRLHFGVLSVFVQCENLPGETALYLTMGPNGDLYVAGGGYGGGDGPGFVARVSPTGTVSDLITGIDGPVAGIDDDAFDVFPADFCGDGVVSGAELCDDGNRIGGDGCSARCDQPTEALIDAPSTGGVPVTTDTELDGATPDDPIETWVTTPEGGLVSIIEGESPAATSLYKLLGFQVQLSAPTATPGTPLVFVFQIDASVLPGDTSSIEVFRNGKLVDPCTGPVGTASPDPCIASRMTLGDGDFVLTVHTSAASMWRFGLPRAPAPFSKCNATKKRCLGKYVAAVIACHAKARSKRRGRGLRVPQQGCRKGHRGRKGLLRQGRCQERIVYCRRRCQHTADGGRHLRARRPRRHRSQLPRRGHEQMPGGAGKVRRQLRCRTHEL